MIKAHMSAVGSPLTPRTSSRTNYSLISWQAHSLVLELPDLNEGCQLALASESFASHRLIRLWVIFEQEAYPQWVPH